MNMSETLKEYFQTNPKMEPHVKQRAYDKLWEAVVPRLEFHDDGSWSFHWMTVAVVPKEKLAKDALAKFYK